MKYIMSLIVLLVLAMPVSAQSIAQHLQDISVTIDVGQGQGSGVLITRDVKIKTADEAKSKVNFVWTAGHVVDSLRSVRKVVDTKSGTEKSVVEFGPAFVVKELTENGRKVGELRMEAKVLKYSNAEDGQDLALMVLHKRNFVSTSATFFLEEKIIDVGTPLIHVGSLLGQNGANSMTTGILSQVGRVLNLNGSNSVVFDQTTVTSFPGSSGGGVFLSDGPNKGQYIGMLVRGAVGGFNYIVPTRRIKEWAGANKLMWALDDKVEVPALEELLKMPVEDGWNTNAEKFVEDANKAKP